MNNKKDSQVHRRTSMVMLIPYVELDGLTQAVAHSPLQALAGKRKHKAVKLLHTKQMTNKQYLHG